MEALATPVPSTFTDMAFLIKRVKQHFESSPQTKIMEVDEVVYQKLKPKEKGRPEIILAKDTAVELGHPSTQSQSLLLLTSKRELVNHGRISLIGPDLDQMPAEPKSPFAQVIMLALKPDSRPDPFDLEKLQFLTNRIQGYAARSMPGRLWIRVSHRGIEAGLTFRAVGAALSELYQSEFQEVEAVEVAFVTSSALEVEGLKSIAQEAAILSGQHKKLAINSDGDLECSDMSCKTCDENEVCDDLREVLVIKKRRKQNVNP
ncbi:hypothetical protein WDW89_04015 [Deltaproteobacteria bacterium TL4]